MADPLTHLETGSQAAVPHTGAAGVLSRGERVVPKKKAEAFAQANDVKVTSIDGEDGALKVALKMLRSGGKGKKKSKK